MSLKLDKLLSQWQEDRVHPVSPLETYELSKNIFEIGQSNPEQEL